MLSNSLMETQQLTAENIFPPSDIAEKVDKLVEMFDIKEVKHGRKWAVVALDGLDPLADVARYIECKRFSESFGMSAQDQVEKYGYYDQSSTFILVLDCEEEVAKPAAALRIVRQGEAGFKTLNTLSSTTADTNPWYDELSDVFGPLEDLEEGFLSGMLSHAMYIDPATTWGIESMAALEEYSGSHGEFGAATLPLYAACLQLSDRAGIESWISGQDIKPLIQMQKIFANPWEIMGLPPKVFEGSLVVPTVIPEMKIAQERLRTVEPLAAAFLIDGVGLEIEYVMPQEIQTSEQLDMLVKHT